jgi:hypothetical protein
MRKEETDTGEDEGDLVRAAEENEEEMAGLAELVRAVRDEERGFAVRDRSYRLKTYPACFVGVYIT